AEDATGLLTENVACRGRVHTLAGKQPDSALPLRLEPREGVRVGPRLPLPRRDPSRDRLSFARANLHAVGDGLIYCVNRFGETSVMNQHLRPHLCGKSGKRPIPACHSSSSLIVRFISKFDGTAAGSRALRATSAPATGRPAGSSNPNCTRTDAWSQ